MKKITIRYGSQSRATNVDSGATIGMVIADQTNKIILGYGDNVKALVHGVEQPGDAVPSDGATITLETKLNQKAA